MAASMSRFLIYFDLDVNKKREKIHFTRCNWIHDINASFQIRFTYVFYISSHLQPTRTLRYTHKQLQFLISWCKSAHNPIYHLGRKGVLRNGHFYRILTSKQCTAPYWLTPAVCNIIQTTHCVYTAWHTSEAIERGVIMWKYSKARGCAINIWIALLSIDRQIEVHF